MPDTGGSIRRQLLDEIRRSREEFYRRMAVEAQDATERLELAYQRRLVEIEQIIREYGLTEEDIPAAIENLKFRITQELDSLQGVIVDVGQAMQDSGIEGGVRAGIAALRRGGMNMTFNTTTLDSVRAVINYVDSPAWRAAVGGFADYHGQRAADILLDAYARGINPKQAAQWLRPYFSESMNPALDALRLARTTQLYGARQGTRAIYQRSGVSQWIWCAAIGSSRTCLACITLHGTVHPSSEVLNDHHLGRCGMMPVTPKWEELGFTDGGEVTFETGIDWLKKQPDLVQIQAMGAEYWKAWQQGLFRLEDVPREYTNEIFGIMRRKATLTELTGARRAPRQ